MDIGWSELLLIGIVALIVVGPKDLPVMFRTLGRFTAKARSMGREFQRAMDDAARESGVGDTAKDLKALTSKKALGLDALDRAATSFEKWDPSKAASKPKGTTTQSPAGNEATAGKADVAKTTAKTPAKTTVKAKAKASPAKAEVSARSTPSAKPKAPKAQAKVTAPGKPAKPVAATAAAKAAPKPRAKKGTS